MDIQSVQQEVATAIAKTVPPAAGAWWTLNEWVAAATIAYIVIQAAILIHKHYYFVKKQK